MPAPRELRFPSIDGLRAFDAAARVGSFERAAEELDITASAVSKRLGTLESLLGAALFTRSGRALLLTASGREYLPQVRSALALLASMPQHRRTSQRVQRLRVSAPPTFARRVLVPALGSFTQALPEVELELLLSIPYLDVQPGESDVEVHAGEPPVGARRLLDESVLPMAQPQAAAGIGATKDLAGEMLLRTPIQPWLPWLRAAGLDWPEPVRGPRFVDLGLTLEAAACGQGVVLARPSLALDLLRAGRLQPLFGARGPRVAAAAPYWARAAAGGPAALAFCDWLEDACRRTIAEAQALLSTQA